MATETQLAFRENLRSCVVPLIDALFSIGRIRKAVWQLWYPFLTRRLRGEEVLFLNYAFETAPPMNLPLAADDEKNRACIQLYHHVATQVSIAGKKVLEISCGHGGGASYLMRILKPQSYTALDLNSAAIAFNRQRHVITGLEFMAGDAEHLPLADNSFEAVINVEASHCYPHFPKFLAEVSRVLKPGGHLLYADFRFRERWSEWDSAFAAAPLQLQNQRDISAEVLRGLERNSIRSQDLVARQLPKFLHNLGRDFAGTRGSRIYQALINGELAYRSYCLKKPETVAVKNKL